VAKFRSRLDLSSLRVKVINPEWGVNGIIAGFFDSIGLSA
jgi:hypothetical protein